MQEKDKSERHWAAQAAYQYIESGAYFTNSINTARKQITALTSVPYVFLLGMGQGIAMGQEKSVDESASETVSATTLTPDSEISGEELSEEEFEREMEAMRTELRDVPPMDPETEAELDKEIEAMLAEASADKMVPVATSTPTLAPALEPQAVDEISEFIMQQAPVVKKSLFESFKMHYDKLKKADSELAKAMGVEASLLSEFSEEDSVTKMLKARAIKKGSAQGNQITNLVETGDLLVASVKGASSSIVKGVFTLGHEVGTGLQSGLEKAGLSKQSSSKGLRVAMQTAAFGLYTVEQVKKVATIPTDMAYVVGAACIDGVLSSAIGEPTPSESPVLNPEVLQQPELTKFSEKVGSSSFADSVIGDFTESYKAQYSSLEKQDESLQSPDKGIGESLYRTPALSKKPIKLGELAAKRLMLSAVKDETELATGEYSVAKTAVKGLNMASATLTAGKGTVAKNLYGAVKGGTQLVCEGVKEAYSKASTTLMSSLPSNRTL